MKKLLIFDLDGTLLNTIDDLGTATNYALSQAGFPTHDISQYPFMVGNGITRLIERALPPSNRSEEVVDAIREKFFEYYDVHCTDLTVPYPGIEQLLQTLTSMDVKVAVASNKYQSAVDKLINHYFPEIPWVAVKGQKPDFPTKPDPSIVFDILSECPTAKQDVLYVGDSGVDMETGRRACVSTCGVSWGFRPVDELERYQAMYIVDKPVQIIRLLDKD